MRLYLTFYISPFSPGILLLRTAGWKEYACYVFPNGILIRLSKQIGEKRIWLCTSRTIKLKFLPTWLYFRVHRMQKTKLKTISETVVRSTDRNLITKIAGCPSLGLADAITEATFIPSISTPGGAGLPISLPNCWLDYHVSSWITYLIFTTLPTLSVSALASSTAMLLPASSRTCRRLCEHLRARAPRHACVQESD